MRQNQWSTGVASLAMVIGIIGFPAVAFGQSTSEQNQRDSDEAIVVTGLKSPTGSQRDIKRSNLGIVDSVTAEQIERLPDLSLAEALGRVAGVSTVPAYNSSEARNLTVRGFDSRYNSMGVDGNPVWNSSRNNRGTQSDIFPASVVNQASVYKTYTPDQDANSIGAHIEMRTLRAFDGGTGTYIKGSAALGWNEQQGFAPGNEKQPYSINAVGKFTFGPDRRFGIVAGFDRQQNNWFDRYNQIAGVTQVNGVDVPASNLSPSIYERVTKREAYYGKIETRATDALYAFLSANYFRSTEDTNFSRGGVFVDAARVVGPTDHAGRFQNATAEIQLQQYEIYRQTLLLAGGLDYRIGDRGALTLRGSFTDYDHDEANHNWDKFQFGPVSGSYAVDNDSFAVTLDPNTNIADPANWRHRTNRNVLDQDIPHEDHVYSARLDYQFNDQPEARGFGYKFGFAFRRLDRVFNQTNNNYHVATGTAFTLADVLSPAQALPITGLGPVIIDGDAYLAFIRSQPLTVDTALASDYHLVEDVYAGHAALNYTTDKLRALVGARVEGTWFTNVTGDTTGGALQLATRRFDYARLLPNAQIVYDPLSRLRVRAAITRAMGRPDFNNFAQGQRVTLDANGYPVVSGSNPYLKPRTSWNYDLSFESYFQNGFAYLGLFRKELKYETFTQRTETRNAAGVVTLTETLPVNNGSGTLNGLEVGVVMDRFAMLPAPFDGLHFEGNFTLLDGTWDVVFTDGSRRSVGGLRNQPKWLANVNLGWKIGRADLNLGYRVSGRVFTGTFGTTPAGDRWIDSYSRLDAQARFKVTDNITVFAEARNITNTFWVQETGLDGQFLYDANSGGRSYYAGTKFTF